MEEQKNVTNMGGSMRLGAYDCTLKEGSKVLEAYGKEHIQERHRHRFEFNNEYKKQYEGPSRKDDPSCVKPEYSSSSKPQIFRKGA